MTLHCGALGRAHRAVAGAKQADLDALFLVPSAAITLQTAAGLNPTGTGSVCFRAAAGCGLPADPGRHRRP